MWCAFAAVGGLCSLVLPPYLTTGGLRQPAYGWPLIPWFAIACANLRLSLSLVCLFVLGLTLGIAQSRWWWLLAVVTMALPPIFLSINIQHDWTHDATSHNLFPIEYLSFAFFCIPALFGAWLGSLFRRQLQRRRGA
jgi:hypothetical protein